MALAQDPTSLPRGSASAAAAPAPREAASSGPTEIVTRPEPGLARGVWEAPTWAFWSALAVVAIATTLYVLHRAGVLRRAPRGPKA